MVTLKDKLFIAGVAEQILIDTDSSDFAGKCHALLCREYIKGRDWYDFSWYVAKKIAPNFVFLRHALEQQGPWANQKIDVALPWFVDIMQQKIKQIDWRQVANDVAPFLKVDDKKALAIWGVDFFLAKLSKLENYCKESID